MKMRSDGTCGEDEVMRCIHELTGVSSCRVKGHVGGDTKRCDSYFTSFHEQKITERFGCFPRSSVCPGGLTPPFSGAPRAGAPLTVISFGAAWSGEVLRCASVFRHGLQWILDQGEARPYLKPEAVVSELTWSRGDPR